MTHSATGLSNAWAIAGTKPEDDEKAKTALAQRRRDDFDFMVLCESKGNMAFYNLFRDTGLDAFKEAKT